jgi:galactose mutarotase-like enzyme
VSWRTSAAAAPCWRPLASRRNVRPNFGPACAVWRARKPRRPSPLDRLELICGGARAEIALRGAELRGWSVGGTPLIWRKDPAHWDETAPILFPIVGWTRDGARVAGERFPLGLHGFARAMNFSVEAHEPARARLALRSGAESLALYPFPFEFHVEYSLAEDSLTTSLIVENSGERPMPYACGLHPGFRWPFAAQGDYCVQFSADEAPFVPEISPQGLFLKSLRPIPLEGRKLALSPALFAAEALCFLNARSRSLRFQHQGGAALIVETTNFPHLALWSKPPAEFLAIECWTGHGDPADFDGDLFEKPSMRVLEPGAVARHEAHYRFAAAP